MSTSNYKSAKWDSTESTYKHIIHFDNEKSIAGYSKRIGFEEVKDKKTLLQNLILRLFKYGYLNTENSRLPNKVDCIEYFWKNKTSQYLLAFTLYQNYFEWNDEVHYREFLNEFLNLFYEIKAKGEDPYQHLYISAKKKVKEPLCLDSKRFYSIFNLQQHCLRIIKNEIRAKGEVMNFYIQYSNKFLDGYDENIGQKFFNSINF